MLESLRSLGIVLGHPPASDQDDEVIRDEIYSAERLEHHAESLAARQSVYDSYWVRHNLAAEARGNGTVLLACHASIAQATQEHRAITPAAEWLLDNFHVIDEQLKSIQQDCTPRTARSLPKLAEGPLRGYPRVYGVIWELVAHTDSRLDPELLKRFLRAYQRVVPLSMRELWAVPLVLRCIMIDNLRRLAVRIVDSQAGRREADKVADGLETADRQTPPDLSDVLRGIAQQSLSRAFAVQLVQRLRYRDLHLPVTLRALNERLAEQGVTWERLIQIEHASQSAANLTVRNLVTSMRAMSAFDWQGLFEEVSLVDASLRKSSAFARMDFLTRDRYRHAIEDLAKGARRPELEVAEALLDRTQRAEGTSSTPSPSDERSRDPGYFLISGGRIAFEQEIGYRVSLKTRLLRGYVTHATQAYLGNIAAITAVLIFLSLWVSDRTNVSLGGLLLLGVLSVIPLSEVAMTLVNRWITRSFSPRHLPRLDLSEGVPASMRTFVVVPIMLTGERAIGDSVRRLENHFLSNPDADVRFALLSDWIDADAQSLPDDARLFQFAAEGIASLNQLHGSTADGNQRFFLFHRQRLWSETQRKWMGWERKRGKLHEFNRLLRGAHDTSFLPADEKPLAPPPDVRYVITLDADTRLPIGTVRQLVGTAAHPLNWPRADPTTGRIVEGYALLQPRITPRLPPRTSSSVYQRLFSAPSGVDAYAAAVSDVYQDLFGEGSYTGKGLYDVSAFETALANRVPENAVLSHDLFEGIFARCALISDVELFEDFPSHSEVAATRNHRWTRGDWQLLPWIFGRAGRDIPAIGRWKMLDNLRRSLLAPACVGLMIASWSVHNAPCALWLLVAILALCLPAILSVLDGIPVPHAGVSLRHHMRMVWEDLHAATIYVAVSLTFLAQQSWLAIDAIIRTLWRLLVSRRKLLEWVTAAQVQGATGLSLGNFLWPLRSAGVVAFGATACVLYFNPTNALIAAPFVLLWWASPLMARAISMPPRDSAAKPLSTEQVTEFRLIARRTWRFFMTFVTAEENSLPPDNFQEDPHPVVAHRSSPTNFGLYLLSIVTARDFGWLGLQDTIERLEATLKSLQALPRHRGHFFNWYDTLALQPLMPQYISSVDSGNLAGHLIALEEACGSMLEKPVYDTACMSGILDTVLMLRRAMETSSDLRRTMTVDITQLHTALDEVEKLLATQPITALEWGDLWRNLQISSGTLLDIAQTFAEERAEKADSEILAWARAVHADVMSHRKEIDLFPRLPGANTPIGNGETGEREVGGSIQTLPNLALGDIPAECVRLMARMNAASNPAEATPSAIKLQAEGIAELERCARNSSMLIGRLTAIAAQARQLFDEMDFTFLFDPRRKLFSIGYRVAEAVLDESYYDLLASEARLTSFIAIAKGEVPVAHWFRLGRPMVPINDDGALVSWSGSMFEYLMPSLIMRTPAESLLDTTCHLVVDRQVEYGQERGVPWGISESAYSQRDRGFTYQYAAFGVPGLGFKRGLANELVVAPYATALAAMYDAPASASNFPALEREGGRGAFGFYEALDFTPARLPEGSRVTVVRAYMAHHQGMSLLALANAVLDGVMRRRFHRHPIAQAAELLLEERTPREIVAARIPTLETSDASVIHLAPTPARNFRTARLPTPATHLLSNGRYTVMITAAGSGFSRWEDLAVTRWREDPTCDGWGSYIFLRDTSSGEVWSAGKQPVGKEPDRYEVVFSEDRARIHRTDNSIATSLEVIVSPEDDAEIRRLSISNNGLRPRQIEVTSYLEVVLAAPAADLAHPVFSNLFVQTEFVPEVRGVLATRRPRKASDPTNWAGHVLAVFSDAHGVIEYETDRARFLGRGRTVRSPNSVMDGRPLSNTAGAVLDPIFSLRTKVRVAPGTTVHLAFSTMVAGSREQIMSLADKYHDPAMFGRISMLAWTHAQVQRHHLGVGADEANLFQYVASALLYFDATLRAAQDTIRRSAGSARQLWRHGISGDHPILLLRIDDADDREIVRQLLRGQEYWRSKRLAVDVVFLNEKGSSYSQDLQDLLQTMVQDRQQTILGAPQERGGLFVLNAGHLSAEDLDLLHRAARIILVSKHGSLAEQVARAWRRTPVPALSVPRTYPQDAGPVGLPTPKLDFFNGLGGFTEDGREYVTVLREHQSTPAPWVNVIANEQLGFLVSESGSSSTWCLNSRENQITPWSNDPVSDWPGEALYIRDEENGRIWSPTALPIRVEGASYIARHGQGFSRFEHQSNGIYSDLLQFVTADDPVKISVLTLENRSGQYRQLSVYAYVEWVLGSSRVACAPYIVTEIDPVTGAMLARNPWNAEFGERVAFFDMGGRQTAWTADRREFIGRNGTLERPRALTVDRPLSGRVGGDVDPCAVLSDRLSLAPGAKSRIVIMLGQATDKSAARTLVDRYRKLDPTAVLAQVAEGWDRTLGVMQVKTPERALDFMLNRWLLYQTLACRIWGRAGFYQPGGAFGFRDQIQDCMALMVSRPQLARDHLLMAAGRQFLEGDVQHWWHPPTGRGVRTHCSDDLLWLPYAVARYVEVTGDAQILDERVSYLEGPPLAAEQEDAYFEPVQSKQEGSLYEHCVRAIERSRDTGPHGLPLIGSGDWNDGMNRVGHAGTGESVWLGWFLHATVDAFAVIAEQRGETALATSWRQHVEQIKTAIEKDAWDGAWYRRAYFDDGTPLGSASGAECRIDSIAQSWGVISGAAEPARAQRAMRSVEAYLVRPGDDLVLLLTPPFDKTPLDPGYIKGYPPGVRENGGQYTHAAVWYAIAQAMQGEGDSAGELIRMLNPVNRTSTRAGVHAYKVEPYVLAADIYSVPPHSRRGGWTWYTGAAGWMYRAGIEWMLGVRKLGNALSIDPCIPREWPGFRVDFRHGNTIYRIEVSNPHNVMRGVVRLEVDGKPLESAKNTVPLLDDGVEHRVNVVLG